MKEILQLNPLSPNFTKWSNTLKQFVGKIYGTPDFKMLLLHFPEFQCREKHRTNAKNHERKLYIGQNYFKQKKEIKMI